VTITGRYNTKINVGIPPIRNKNLKLNKLKTMKKKCIYKYIRNYQQIMNTSIKLKQMTRQKYSYIKSTMVLCVHDNRRDGHEVLCILYIYYIQCTVDVAFQINNKKTHYIPR